MTVEAINQLDRAGFTAALGHLFEHSPWVADETWPEQPFRDEAELHGKLCAVLRSAPAERKLALICAHPDLAGRLARQRQLTAESTREQASAGLDSLSDEELGRFQTLNDLYRVRFGFPFVICARLNAKNVILQAMEQRLDHSPEVEMRTAIAEIEKIARLRLQDVLHS